MREFFRHTLTIEKPIQDCFSYIAHTFENAPSWMEGCKNIVVRPGFERFGMWEGKTYDRTFALPFHIGSSTKPDVILKVEEENPYKFDEEKRFIVTMKSPAVDPIFDNRFTAMGADKTQFDYSISTEYQGPICLL